MGLQFSTWVTWIIPKGPKGWARKSNGTTYYVSLAILNSELLVITRGYIPQTEFALDLQTDAAEISLDLSHFWSQERWTCGFSQVQ